MLTKVLALVLVVLIGLALGIETARYVHAYATGVDASGVVNIHHALGFSLLATSGALLLSLSREWLSRQWTRFTVWLELTWLVVVKGAARSTAASCGSAYAAQASIARDRSNEPHRLTYAARCGTEIA